MGAGCDVVEVSGLAMFSAELNEQIYKYKIQLK